MSNILFKAIAGVIKTAEDNGPENPLTFRLNPQETSSGSVKLTVSDYIIDLVDIWYKTESKKWTQYESGTEIPLTDHNSFVSFWNKTEVFGSYDIPSWNYGSHFDIIGMVDASGNIQSLHNYSNKLTPNCYKYLFAGNFYLMTAPELPATELAPYCYSEMFKMCQLLTNIPDELPATQLAEGCYHRMFQECYSLKIPPRLPATQLTPYCYYEMFSSCETLITAPELPATQLAFGCYFGMLGGCYELHIPPELPATQLAEGCYSYMFSYSGITSAPKLPATQLAESCYSNMFSCCVNLITAPELPATQLALYCYDCMFGDCYSLQEAPELPATQLALYCYSNMFSYCENLITAPELPATQLAEGCYFGMFSECNSLREPPELPATELAPYCYSYMFSDSGIETAPELPATQLAEGCYLGMFTACLVLTSVKVRFTEWGDDMMCTEGWLQAAGIFVENPVITIPESLEQIIDDYHIPEYWSIQTFTP